MPDGKSLPRFYVSDLVTGQTPLPAEEAHHARQVLRLGSGAGVVLFDGRGHWAEGELLPVGKAQAVVWVGTIQQEQPPQPRIHLAFAVPKGKRLDWLLEKATELSAASLRSIVFERSVAGGETLSEAKKSRWLAHCVAAAKQCGLNWLPLLEDTMRLGDFLDHAAGGLRLFGDTGPEAKTLPAVLSGGGEVSEVTLLIGPEGGLTEEERRAALSAGFLPVRLGSTTLRVETAAIALLAVLRGMLGE